METNKLDIWERALAFMDAQALLTAHRLGVFDVLACSGAAAAQVAQHTDLPVASCERLLSFLAALGFVHRRPDGSYENHREIEHRLVRERPEYEGQMFAYVAEVLYPAWQHLEAALASQQAPWERLRGSGASPHEEMFADASMLRNFLAGMHTITYTSARSLAAQAPELACTREIVDVGGATGAFLIALAERFPRLQGLVVDLPPVVAIAVEYIRRAGLDGRVRTASGDFWRDALPAGADAYALGFILHDWDDEGCDVILNRISVATPAGARLILGEQLLDPDRTGPLFAVRQDVNMLVSARGRERTLTEYAELIGRHGFRIERTCGTAYGKHYMIARRR